VNNKIRYGNTDIYKNFWNEDSHTNVIKPKVEDTCRDRLIDQLKPYYANFHIRVEPEGHMASDKRADIVLLKSHDQKLPLELKCDTHDELWTACEKQLDRMYTRDPGAQGYGIYIVFWFGAKRTKGIKKPPEGIAQPCSPEELRESLKSLIKPEDRNRLDVFILDVTQPFPKEN